MRIVLAGVPHSPPFSPQLALPLLLAGLQRRGHQAAIIDGGLAAMERLWSQAAVAAGFEHLPTMTSGRIKSTSFPFDIASRLQRCGCDVDDVDSFLQELRCALALLRGHLGESRFRLPDAYDHAIRVVQLALGIASVPFLPECADLRTYRPPRPIRTSQDLIAHARRSQDRALFGATLLESLPREILGCFGGGQPEVVGISIAWPSQLGPAAMLACGLRRAGFLGPIVWGGSLVSHLLEGLVGSPDLREAGLVDAIMPRGDAETLHQWACTLGERAADSASARGIVVRGNSAGDRSESAPRLHRLSGIPTPAFEMLRLDAYLSPRPVLPLLASTGCYYGRCIFCSHDYSVRHRGWRRGVDVVADMRRLHERTGCREFYLVDDCTSPETMRELATELLAWRRRRGPPVGWITSCRAEPVLIDDEILLPLLAASGCRMLMFGLESADGRVLESMRKGTEVEVLRGVLARAKACGIKTWCFYMLGFPTEDGRAAQKTHDFLVEMRETIDVIAGGPFVLTRHAPLASNPERYFIEIGESRLGGSDDAVDDSVDMVNGQPCPAGPLPARSSAPLSVSLPYRGGAMTSDERDLRLERLRLDARLEHFLHPVVVEAHGLFLQDDYYHRVSAGCPWLQALLNPG